MNTPTQPSPPDYAKPVADTCYLCGLNPNDGINWRGHFICQKCFDLQQNKAMVEKFVALKLPGTEGSAGILNPTAFSKGPNTSAHALLEQAASTIEQRGKDYNSPGGERSMKATVEAFNAITRHKLTPTEGWKFMVILKLVRSQHSPEKRDSFVDGAAYFALAGEESLGSKLNGNT